MERFDPGKAWADKGAGTKIRIALAAIGRGLQGGNPQEVFNDVLQRELAAHRQMRSDEGEKLKSARSDLSNALTQRDTFLALAQDERVADAMLEASTLRKIQAKMEAMKAEYGPRIITDQWREAEAKLAQMSTDTDYKLAQLEAATPKHYTRRVSTMGSNERRIRQEMGDQMIDTAGEAQKQGIGAMAAQQKQQARDEYGLTDRDWGQIEKYGADADAAKLEAIVRQVDSITAPTDIKGVSSIGKDWIGDEPRDLNHQLFLLEEAIGRAQSGAAISEEEGQRFRDMIEAGVALGGGEERLRKNLGEVRRMMNARLETKRRSLSPAAQRYITRGDATQYTSERHDAGRGRKRVQASDGSITTDRSEFE